MNRIESPEAQLLELLRRADGPSVVDRERVRRQIAAKVAVGAVATAAVLAVEPASWYVRLGALSGWLKGATVATALVTVASGAVYLGARTKTAPPAAETQSLVPTKLKDKDVTRTEEASSVVSRDQAPEVTESRDIQPSGTSMASQSSAAASGGPAGKAASKGSGSGLEAELALLGKAQQALKAGSPAGALRALDEHQRRFPGGVLSFERAGVRTVALCQSGRLDEGRSAARSYLHKVPNSVLSKRIRVACQLQDE